MNEIKEQSAVGVGAPATESRENSTTEIITRAIEKINTCGKFKDRYASVIAEPVKRALQEFCRQEEEFARAVIDGGSAEERRKWRRAARQRSAFPQLLTSDRRGR